MEVGADYMLWLDSDVKFPPDLLFRLLRWNVDIVGCNYPQKKIPSHPTVFISPEGVRERFPEEVKHMKDGKMMGLISRKGQTGIIKCMFLGFGALLMKVECFKRVPPPWFDITWVPDTNDYEGEDVCCLRRMKEAGYDVYCDLETSNLISHIGDFEFTHELTEGYYGTPDSIDAESSSDNRLTGLG